MFTGIVSSVGKVIEAGSHRLGIRDAATARSLRIGSSVAVNGCCLTVVKKAGTAFFADVVPETLRRTNLGLASPGVHGQPRASAAPRPGGSTATSCRATSTPQRRVRRVDRAAAGLEVEIELPASLRSFVVEKGSIAVDGMSLTVAGVAGLARSPWRSSRTRSR